MINSNYTLGNIQFVKSQLNLGAIFYVSTSGGKDSQAMYLYLTIVMQIPADRIVLVHSDLGEMEWPGTQAHIRATVSHHLNVVHAIDKHGDEKTLLSIVERKAAEKPNQPAWPSAAARWCTSDLKRGPIYKFIRNDLKQRGGLRAVNCMGLRAEESSARAKLDHLKLNQLLSKAGRTIYDWLPIHDWSTTDVFAWIKSNGQVAHWAYADGNERLSCMFCILGSPNDLRHAARVNPQLAAKYADLEQRSGFTLFHKRSLADVIASDGGTT